MRIAAAIAEKLHLSVRKWRKVPVDKLRPSAGIASRACFLVGTCFDVQEPYDFMLISLICEGTSIVPTLFRFAAVNSCVTALAFLALLAML